MANLQHPATWTARGTAAGYSLISALGETDVDESFYHDRGIRQISREVL